MISVYIEKGGIGELAAIFQNKPAYDACVPALAKLAADKGAKLTITIDGEVDINDTDRLEHWAAVMHPDHTLEQVREEIDGHRGVL